LFLPNIAAKETHVATAVLQGNEALPEPSTSTNDAALVNIHVCHTSKEQSSVSSHYPSTSKVHVLPTIICLLLQAVVSKQRKKKK
jgi:hypothetical protein